jgi:Ca-activated chloride channel family protein
MSRRLVWLLLIAGAAPGAAQVCLEQTGPPITMGEVAHGALLLRTAEPGGFVAAPVLDTAVHIVVTGIIARTEVRQRFTNPSDEWVEGVYVFPLPDGAAVDTLHLVVGQTVLEGEIREREEARRTYEQAQAEGRRASLLEQQRPNIFTTSVANLGPHEQAEVVIEYQETVRYAGGVFSLRFPLVVGPRYIPGSPLPCAPTGSGGAPATDRVPDASLLTPPVLPPTLDSVNPVSLRVDLDAGVPLARISSLYHPVEVRGGADGHATITLQGGTTVADRDFALEWVPETGREPRAAIFAEELGGDSYALLMVLPPAPAEGAMHRLLREMVLVIDTSGSMQGASIGQARAAVIWALRRLEPGDSFRIIAFDNLLRQFPLREVSPGNIDEAAEWVSALDARGGTGMRPALEAALADDGDDGRLRQVVFVTDGCVGNEDELLGVLHRQLGRSRLFTVGIGSAPNSHLMHAMAEAGRGTFTFIGRPEEVGTRMGELLGRISTPVLADVDARWDDATAESYPARVPDLYLGEPLVVVARLNGVWGSVSVAGRRDVFLWQQRLSLERVGSARGIARLWARRKIATLMDALAGGAGEAEVRPEVVQVGLRYHLVSRYTSLVAVDVTPVTPAWAAVTRPVPTNLPAGWSYEHVFGGMPQTATPSRLLLLIGLAAVLAAVALQALWGARP